MITAVASVYFSPISWQQSSEYDAFSDWEIVKWSQAATGGVQCCISKTGLLLLLSCNSMSVINAAMCNLQFEFNWPFLYHTNTFSQPEPAVLLFMSHYVPFLCPSLHLICTGAEMKLSVPSCSYSPPPYFSYIRCQPCWFVEPQAVLFSAGKLAAL